MNKKTGLDNRSLEQARYDMAQAIANCKIEGFKPDADFLADTEMVVTGEMTADQAIAKAADIARQEDTNANRKLSDQWLDSLNAGIARQALERGKYFGPREHMPKEVSLTVEEFLAQAAASETKLPIPPRS